MQTLYLTELLNLSMMDNPTFGRFYLGVATHDTLKCLPVKLKLDKKQSAEDDHYYLVPIKQRRMSKH